MPDTIAQAVRAPFWNDTVGPQPDCPSLAADARCDLAIVGGGFTGLWTALEARRRQPDACIVLVDGGAAATRRRAAMAGSARHRFPMASAMR